MPSWCAFPQVVANAGAWWPEQNHCQLLHLCYVQPRFSAAAHWQSIRNAIFTRNQGPNPQMPFRWQVVPNSEGQNDAESLHLDVTSTRLLAVCSRWYIHESCWRITSATCLAKHQSVRHFAWILSKLLSLVLWCASLLWKKAQGNSFSNSRHQKDRVSDIALYIASTFWVVTWRNVSA